jgi:HEAT repeat protein
MNADAGRELLNLWPRAATDAQKRALVDSLPDDVQSPSVAALLGRALADGDLSTVIDAIDRLEKFETVPDAAIPGLVKALEPGQDLWHNDHAANLLRKVAPRARGALIAELRDRSELEWWAYPQTSPATLLGEIGNAAVDPLLDVLRNGKAEARIQAALALGKIRPARKDAIKALLAIKTPPEVKTQEEAALWQTATRALGEIGPTARLAVPRLLEEADSTLPTVRQEAITALGKIHAPEAIPRLRQVLSNKNEDAFVRRTAADALADIGPKAKTAVPELIACLDDPYVRKQCVVALGAIGPDAAAAVSRMIKILSNEKESSTPFIGAYFGPVLPKSAFNCILETVEAMGRIGRAARPAVPAIKKAMNEAGDHLLIDVADGALMRIGSREAVEAIRCDEMSHGEALQSPARLLNPEDTAKNAEQLYPTKIHGSGTISVPLVVRLDAAGKIMDVSHKSSPRPGAIDLMKDDFTAPAIGVGKLMRFSPATCINGIPTATRLQETVDFRLR